MENSLPQHTNRHYEEELCGLRAHLFISKNLERIADHASNVAEMVVFMVKGETIRHMDKSKQ